MFKITESCIVDPYLMEQVLPCFDNSDREEVAKRIFAGDTCYTFWGDDKVIGIMGATLMTNSSMYGWSLLDVGIRKFRFSFAKKMREFINDVMKQRNLVRFFVVIDQDNRRAIRQNEWMGLEFEGILRKAGSKGQNQVLMAKVGE